MNAERRRFNSGERVSLFVTAEGHCSECGVELKKGWHADHVVPWSLGGATDVTNGQALCGPCNLSKGKKMDPLRTWQTNALEAFEDHGRDTFLAVATPGAGKTRLALEAFKKSGARRLIVVTPSTRLRHQWRAAANAHGVQLDDTFTNADCNTTSDFVGIVVTYHAVAQRPPLYRLLTDSVPTFVVLDEIHHCGDEKTWGDGIQYAFQPAMRRLLLSGTPFRSDDLVIPFVNYEPGADGKPTSVPDFRYGYGEALIDGVVREVEFSFFDGEAQWVNAGKMITSGIKTSGSDEGKAIASAVMPESDWSRVVLTEANRRLALVRRDIPNAGALVIANSQPQARRFRKLLEQITGAPVGVAVSDDRDAIKVIDAYARSTAPWLVAVNMVSEGVDIPRLMVGVYATTIRTDLFVRQAVGRFVRTSGDEEDSVPATVFMPSAPTLIEQAHAIEVERDHVIEADPNPLPESSRDRVLGDEDRADILPAISGHHDQTVFNGQSMSAGQIAWAVAMMERHSGVSGSPAAVAAMLADALGGSADMPFTPPVPTESASERRNRLRSTASRLVRRLAYITGREHKAVWSDLNAATDGMPVGKATIEGLEARIRVVHGWLHDASQS